MFGLGEILGCFFIGYIVDKFGSRSATYVNIGIMALMSIITIVYCVLFDFGFLAFLMCFLWGFQDSAVNTHAQEILGFEFDNNSEPFSVYNILQCIACPIFQIIQIYIDNYTGYLVYSIFVCIIGMGCVINTIRFKFRDTDRKVLMQINQMVSGDKEDFFDR
jgi:MFS family permease